MIVVGDTFMVFRADFSLEMVKNNGPPGLLVQGSVSNVKKKNIMMY